MLDWVEETAKRLLKKRRDHTIATGVSPSGPIHIGNMREVMIADSVAKALRELGGEPRLLYFADSLDPLRRVYPFLPKSYETHIGKPLSEIPDPEGCCSSYADHFLRQVEEVLPALGVDAELLRTDRLYKEGRYAPLIHEALRRRDDVARAIDEVSGRTSPKEWSPFLPICHACGRLSTTVVTGFNEREASYRCSCGHEGAAPFAGGGKLGWRVDWPARWRLFGVTVEPFGKDIGAAGGSYDSGVRIARELFGCEPPYPIYFEHVLLRGEGGGKLSKSAGVTLTAGELLEVMPPDALRFLLTRTKPEKHIQFDPGLPLVSALDSYDTKGIPMSHMVTCYQVARGDPAQLLEALRRGGYDASDARDVERRAGYARRWLERFAPAEAKFELQAAVPPAARDLSAAQRQGLLLLVGHLDKDAAGVHDAVYEIAQGLNIPAKELFGAIYTVLLGKRSGPRAGWFLKSLERGFVERRLREVGSFRS